LFGDTPLVAAVWGNSLFIVQKLIAAGADVHVCSNEGVTPLIIGGMQEIRAMLKSTDVDVKITRPPICLN
jgi:ankyrin repeat protein